MTNTDFQKGLKTRRSVLGDDHVDRAIAAQTDLDDEFQQFITEVAWGKLWSDEGLTKRERSLLVIALLAAQGNESELALHLKATSNTGASLRDIKQVLMHVAVYSGVPAANSAFRIAKEVFKDAQ
jgi:4-carboxymuconolactone decarboxylase